jgi:hypothetical protein
MGPHTGYFSIRVQRLPSMLRKVWTVVSGSHLLIEEYRDYPILLLHKTH